MKLPESARAAVLRRFGAPLEIEDVPAPGQIEPGALLVEVDACSICGTDVHLAAGELALRVDLPVILGHEMVGRVAAMGPGADVDSLGQPVRVGDRVTWSHTSCGHCFYCTVEHQPTLCSNRRAYMFESMERPPHLVGGFAEYCYVWPESGRVRIPDVVDDDLASMSSCAFRSVMNALDQTGEISPQHTVAVQGVGPLGLLACAVLEVAGVRRVIAIGAPEARLALAREFGAEATISIEETPDPAERRARIRAETDGRGPDVVFDFTGAPQAFREGLEMVRPGGRYMVVGQLGDGEATLAPSLITKKNLTVLGSFSADIRHYWKALRFLERHHADLPFHKVISNRYALDEVNTALARMRAFEEIKPVLYPRGRAA